VDEAFKSAGENSHADPHSSRKSFYDSKPQSAGFGFDHSDEGARHHVERILGRPGFDPATGRMDSQWYTLHTMHANLTQAQVLINCQLRTAVKMGLEDEVQVLVEQGAMLNQPMPDYIFPPESDYEDAILAVVWPPLHWAASKDLASMVLKLVKLGAHIDAIDATITKGRYYWDDECPIRSKLSDQESRNNYNLQMNMTAIHWACFHGNAQTVEVLCQLGASVTLEDDRNRTCIEIAAYQAMHPKYKKKDIFGVLKRRLMQEVGESWEQYWPQLCNDTYYNSFDIPDTVAEMTPEQLWKMEFPGHGPNRTLANLSSVDIDQILRKECRAFDDPTVFKNEAHLRYHVRYPELQFVEPYVEGKPFYMWDETPDDERENMRREQET